MSAASTELQLARAFAEGFSRRALAPVRLEPELEAKLRSLVESCEQAWPGFRLEPVAFVEHLARHVAADDLLDALQRLHSADLYLALAVGTGDQVALGEFARHYDVEIERARSRLGRSLAVNDLKQEVYQRLFLAHDAPPRVLEYSGRGTLRAWFRVATARTLLGQLRGAPGETLSAGDIALGVPSPDADPEIAYLKRKYQHEFKAAFERAVASLSPEERNVLRCYFADNLSIDEIAAMFGIHRATAARRVSRARDSLSAETCRQMSAQLQLSPSELDSVLRLIESQLEMSVGRLLRG